MSKEFLGFDISMSVAAGLQGVAVAAKGVELFIRAAEVIKAGNNLEGGIFIFSGVVLEALAGVSGYVSYKAGKDAVGVIKQD